jgi:ribosomal protein L7/L12
MNDNLLAVIEDLIEERKELQEELARTNAFLRTSKKETAHFVGEAEYYQQQRNDLNDSLKAYQEEVVQLGEKLSAAEKNSLRPTTQEIVNSRPGSTYYESLKDCWRLNSSNRPTKIPAIKRLRTFTDAGLKEAKEAVEALWMKWDVEAAKKDTEGELQF